MIKYSLLDESKIVGSDVLDMFLDNNFNSILTDYAKDMINDVSWWIKKDQEDINGKAVFENNLIKSSLCSDKNRGLRVSVNYSEVEPFVKNIRSIKENIASFNFGMYPNSKVSEEKSIVLSNKLSNHELIKLDIDNTYKDIDDNNYYLFANEIWYLYQPITWILDVKSNIAITKDIIDQGKNYYQTVSFLKKEFGNIILLDNEELLLYIKLKEYNELQDEKSRIDGKLSILDNEINKLRRRKK